MTEPVQNLACLQKNCNDAKNCKSALYEANCTRRGAFDIYGRCLTRAEGSSSPVLLSRRKCALKKSRHMGNTQTLRSSRFDLGRDCQLVLPHSCAESLRNRR